VSLIPPSEWTEKGIWGEFDPEHSAIKLMIMHEPIMQWTFLHEVVHSVLTSMNHKLNKDEKFIDHFSGLLHQALETFEYED
jgi:hypothetical protein